jgi:predicted DNA binding CopG/RHH family protein
MSEIRLDEEEKALLSSYENDEWEPVPNFEEEKEKYPAYAQATFKKDRRVNIRISSKNLEALHQKALEEGIPYQTLIGSILHKYVTGRLVERS